MKKSKSILLFLILAFVFASCSKKEGAPAAEQLPEVQQEVSEEQSQQPQQTEQTSQEETSSVQITTTSIEGDSSIAFDLTNMNPNMVYAQIFNLMMEPEQYAGKIFKMTGNFLKLTGPDGKPAYAVIIKDALACCQQGVEFKFNFAGAEPSPDQQITVVGPYTVSENADGVVHNYVSAIFVEM